MEPREEELIHAALEGRAHPSELERLRARWPEVARELDGLAELREHLDALGAEHREALEAARGPGAEHEGWVHEVLASEPLPGAAPKARAGRRWGLAAALVAALGVFWIWTAIDRREPAPGTADTLLGSGSFDLGAPVAEPGGALRLLWEFDALGPGGRFEASLYDPETDQRLAGPVTLAAAEWPLAPAQAAALPGRVRLEIAALELGQVPVGSGTWIVELPGR